MGESVISSGELYINGELLGEAKEIEITAESEPYIGCSIKELSMQIKYDKELNNWLKYIKKEKILSEIFAKRAQLEKLEPYGELNKCPMFLYKNLKVDSIRSLTEGKHMKLTLKSDNGNIITAMGFNMGHRAEEFLIGDKVDIVGMLEINEFNGIQSIQFNLKDSHT